MASGGNTAAAATSSPYAGADRSLAHTEKKYLVLKRSRDHFTLLAGEHGVVSQLVSECESVRV